MHGAPAPAKEDGMKNPKNEPGRPESERIVAAVRENYGKIAARTGPATGCCGPDRGRKEAVAGLGYDRTDLDGIPDGANLDLGCGAPIAFLDLRPGETVLDLGSGAGLDALLAARRVGPKGRVIGVDMTPEMLDRARANAAAAGLDQVEFRFGRLEAVPVDSESVDAVTSNCVINLVPDKAAVFAEIARVLRPGGRLVISDIILDDPLPEALVGDLRAYAGCLAGAMPREPYFLTVREAGLSGVKILADVDFLPRLRNLPGELLDKLRSAAGFRPADLEGVIRSITFRAGKG